ncbi:MAG TPA: hypothetical protein VJ753_04185 [Rhizomicrobium sp.]|nr:hypothetical protein [Rhizomicrobium sp.]
MRKVGFVGLFTLLTTVTAAQADLRDDALAAVQRCSGVSDKAQRLACFDSAAVQVPGALNAPVTASAEPARPQPRQRGNFFSRMLGLENQRPPQTTVAQFGSESIANGGMTAFPTKISGDTVHQIRARLTAYEFTGGYVTVTLDNGQVWRQSASDSPLGGLVKPAPSYAAAISRDRGGSYAMKLSGLAGTIAVRRLQ